MQRKFQSALEQIKSIEREFYAIKLSLEFYQNTARSQSKLIPFNANTTGRAINIEHIDFVHAVDNLEATYVVRIFVPFEKALREAWKSFQREKKSPLKDIIDGLQARMKFVPEDAKVDAHEFRLFRNGLMHGKRIDSQELTLSECRKIAAGFIKYLQK